MSWPLIHSSREDYLRRRADHYLAEPPALIGLIWELDDVEMKRLTALDKQQGVSKRFLATANGRRPIMVVIPGTVLPWSPDLIAKFDDPEYTVSGIEEEQKEGKKTTTRVLTKITVAERIEWNGFRGRITKGILSAEF